MRKNLTHTHQKKTVIRDSMTFLVHCTHWGWSPGFYQLGFTAGTLQGTSHLRLY